MEQGASKLPTLRKPNLCSSTITNRIVSFESSISPVSLWADVVYLCGERSCILHNGVVGRVTMEVEGERLEKQTRKAGWELGAGVKGRG